MLQRRIFANNLTLCVGLPSGLGGTLFSLSCPFGRQRHYLPLFPTVWEPSDLGATLFATILSFWAAV